MTTAKNKTLKIDGSTGEGGGQIIRTALSLSMLTGIPIEITHIRAGRAKSGLMRQHLVCLQASQQISDAKVTGAHLGSTAFSFTPNAVKAGNYQFDIGSAGSTTLVLQTLLPALLFANSDSSAKSTVTIKGGTHNPLAPTTDFLTQAFLPALAKLGMQVDIQLLQAGFAPVGGGVITATISPFMRRADTAAFELTERDKLLHIELIASILNLDYDICTRELASSKAALIEAGIYDGLITTQSNKLQGVGEGNSCYAIVTHQLKNTPTTTDAQAGQPTYPYLQYQQSHNLHHEVFTLLGEKRTSAEKMGKRLAGLVKRYLSTGEALVDEHLTDQLLLPLALAGGGEFSARVISQHTETQAWLIEQFLPVKITFETLADNQILVQVIC